MLLTDLIIYATVVIAGLVHGLLGIGFPMVATPIIALVGDVRSAVVLLLLPTLAINLVNVIRGGHWHDSIGRFWPLALFGAVGSLFGTHLLATTNPAPYNLLLGAMILLYLNHHRLGIRLGWIPHHIFAACALFGFLGGLLAGTVNVMLPALIIFSLELKLKPLVSIQMFNFCFMIGKLSQGVILIHHGLLNPSLAKSSLVLVLLALTALMTGIFFRDRIDPATYRRWLKRALVFIAVLLFVKYIKSVLI